MESGSNDFGIFPNDLEKISGINGIILNCYHSCKNIGKIISKSFGPAGTEKLFYGSGSSDSVSSETTFILKNIKFPHPASKIIIFSTIYQDQELGEGSGFLFLFTTELLSKAIQLLEKGYSSIEIGKSFDESCTITLHCLSKLATHRLANLKNLKSLGKIISSSLKNFNEDIKLTISPQIAYIFSRSFYKFKSGIHSENIRVVKILGGTIEESKTIVGTVILRGAEGSIQQKKNAKIILFSCPFDLSTPESKSSTVLTIAEQLMLDEKSQISWLKEKVEFLVKENINVVIATGFSKKIVNILDKKKIMAIKIQSRYDLKRVSCATGAKINSKLKNPSKNDIGYAISISVRSFGNQKIILFQNDEENCSIFTLIIRANSQFLLNKIERFVRKSCGYFRTLCRDNRLLIGGGCSEIQLMNNIRSIVRMESISTDRLILRQFIEAFEVIPSVLTQNSGGNTLHILPRLNLLHAKGKKTLGLNVIPPRIIDAKKKCIWDSFSCKYWAIRSATENVIMILSIDQIIMAKESNR